MTLKPTDMLEIQTAIDAYERKFPRRPAPSAEVALAWRLGKKEWARRQAAAKAEQESESELGPTGNEPAAPALEEQEPSRLASAWEQLRLQWLTGPSGDDVPIDLPAPWIKNALMVGWWGMVAVMVASVFVFGAIVGGFK